MEMQIKRPFDFGEPISSPRNYNYDREDYFVVCPRIVKPKQSGFGTKETVDGEYLTINGKIVHAPIKELASNDIAGESLSATDLCYPRIAEAELVVNVAWGYGNWLNGRGYHFLHPKPQFDRVHKVKLRNGQITYVLLHREGPLVIRRQIENTQGNRPLYDISCLQRIGSMVE